MRIISGTHKGRVLHPPSNLPVRPTTDMAKTGLFNILNTKLDYTSSVCIDLFSGTGAISYELASRGCEKIFAVEQNKACIQYIKQTIGALGFQQIIPIHEDALRFLKTTSVTADFIFSDAPYDFKLLYRIPEFIIERGLINTGGWLIIEHDEKRGFSDHPNFLEQRRYGKVNFSIFQF